MRTTRHSVTGLFLTLLLAGVAAIGQENYGAVLGTVLDQSGAGVPGAKLVATSPTVPRPIEVETDSQGRFAMQRLQAGVYSITISKSGFTTVRQANLEVAVGSQITFNPTLKVSNIAETIEVNESAVSIDPTSSRTATNISATVFDNLPRSRSFESILTMAPGVRLEPKASSSSGAGNASRTTGIQVDGASGSENSYIIDGVDVSDIRRGTLRSNNAIPFEFIGEVQVKSAGMDADAPGATGGVVNVVTKAGSNDFHGQLLMQMTNNVLNPRPRGFWKNSPANANLPDFFAQNEDEYTQLYPGGMISGPMVKNRLYFTAGYMPQFEKRNRIMNYPGTGLVSGTRQYRQEVTNHFGLARMDYSPTDKIQVNTSWIWSPVKVRGNLPNADPRIAAPSNDLSVQGGFQSAQAYTANATYTLTPRFLISARYGYKMQNDKLFNYGLSGAPFITYNTAAPAGVPVPGSNGYSNVSSTFGIEKDVTDRHNVYLDGSYLANAGGQHTIKFGYAINRVGNSVQDDFTNGRFTVNWGEAFSRGSIAGARGTYGYYRWEDGVRHNASVNGRNQGLYVNDNWKMSKRLTLNLGLRMENEFLPPYTKEVNGKKIANPISFGWGSKLAPRLGAAWDIFGDGRWKLAGSFGLYYDTMKYELARGSFAGDYWWTHVYQLNDPNVLALSKANPGALGTKITQYNNRSVPINDQGELDGIDPDIKPYTQREFTVRLDHALTNRLTMTVRYSKKSLLKVIEDIGVLDAEDSEVYLIGNPGFGETRNTASVYGQKTPKGEFVVPAAKREYNGLEFRVQGNVARNTYMLASYTYSRLFGNYSGTANSDENGRSDPGVSRAFDLPYYYFNAQGSNAEGLLATDRPNTFTFFASHDLKWGGGASTLGWNQIAFSGTPLSSSYIYLSAPTYPNGRGDLGRTPSFIQSDVSLKHTIKVSERWTLAPEINVINLFNKAAVTNTQTQMNRTGAISTAALPIAKFFSGYNVNDYVSPANPFPNVPFSPIFNRPTAYQTPREVRIGLRLVF